MSLTINSAFSAENNLSRITRNRTDSYKRLVLCAYVIFFAGIAPFICWGTVGDPNHSHAGTHFVFDEEAIMVQAVHSTASHGHDYCQHDPVLRHNRLAPERFPDVATPEPETRSAPIVTLISLLIVISFFAVRSNLYTSIRNIIRANSLILAQGALVPVPTPPPRYATLAA